MSLQIKSKCVVGIRFSDLCSKMEFSEGFYYTYITEKFEKSISKKFEDRKIIDEEVSPELISLVFELDYFEFEMSDKKDAIIGLELSHTDVGKKNVDIVSVTDTEMLIRKVEAYVKGIDASILEKLRLEFCIITKMKEAEE